MMLITHLFFGFGVTFLGSWWCISALKRYLVSRSTNTRFTSSSFYPDQEWSSFPSEPALKGVFLILQFGIELALNIGGYETLPTCGSSGSGDLEVLAVLWRCWLILYVCVEVVQFYHQALIHRGIPYICLLSSAALISSCLPILPPNTHLSLLELLVAQLFMAAILIFAVSTLFEMILIHSLAFALIRAGSTVLIGLWIMTLAFILDPPIGYFAVWKSDNPRSVKDVFLLFGCIVSLSVMYIAWIVSQLMTSASGAQVTVDNVVLRQDPLLANKVNLISVKVCLSPLPLANKDQTFV